MTSGDKRWGLFFPLGKNLTSSSAAELFISEGWGTGLMIPVGKGGRRFYFPPRVDTNPHK